MEMTDQEKYRKFVEWLDNPVWEFTESEAMMPMIMSYISPEEAEFMTGIPLNAKTIPEIAAIKNMDPDEIAPKIKALCEKGLMYESMRGDSVRYKLLVQQVLHGRVVRPDGRGPSKRVAGHPDPKNGRGREAGHAVREHHAGGGQLRVLHGFPLPVQA
ncbi:MAG: hypothetical protein JRK53_00190 [Deltaproteobacteria bacterium]|nr:hypothetical protein [Deltaproteobacteria bacterium]